MSQQHDTDLFDLVEMPYADWRETILKQCGVCYIRPEAHCLGVSRWVRYVLETYDNCGGVYSDSNTGLLYHTQRAILQFCLEDLQHIQPLLAVIAICVAGPIGVPSVECDGIVCDYIEAFGGRVSRGNY